jgi:hypothetical protein
MNQYIITKEKIQIILDYIGDEQDSDELRFAAFDVLNNLRLYSPQAEFNAAFDEGFEIGKSQCETHHDEIKQSEREMILDEAIKRIKQNRDCRKRTIELNKDLSDIKLNAKTVSIFAMAADNDSISILEELRQKDGD